ncbi:MAG: metallophosphoesterase [Clostridia bacterium]|nr:metallophosphoesterase [Clostridia bacterium]
MKTKTKRLLLVMLSLALVFSSLALVISASVSGRDNVEPDKKINVWLIAGQSNAVGYGETTNYPDGYSDGAILDAGIENVLYYGKGYGNDITNFVPVTFGLGKDASYSGAEIGIATALSKSGEKHVIIKYANGDTQLSANGVTADNNIATWTPPSYIEANPDIAFDGDKIGDLYDGFISTVKEALTKLEKEGYTPVVQGFWWMQGERDGNHGDMTADLYSTLLKTLISDVRRDVGIITGEDLSDMPAVYGRVYRNPAYAPNSEAGLAAVQAGQDKLAADTTIKNVAMLDTRYDLVDPESGKAKDLVQQDGWHYDTLTQQMIGEAFVRKAYSFATANLTAVSTTPVTIANNEQALYSAVANYVIGCKVNIKLGTTELFSISDGGLTILGAEVNGDYRSGDYKVYVSVNPAQNMTIVEVTLPDGGIVRKGAYNKHSGSGIVAYATNAERVKDVSLSYENLVLNEYEVVTIEPSSEGFGANVYNLVTSFTDATSSRHFAWTAKAEFIGSNAMAIKYRVNGASEWIVADAYKLTEPTEYADEDYFKADVSGLVANTEYEYKIGVKGSSDEVNDWSKAYTFTTATGDEKEFTFIAVGDTQGITWGGTEVANKGFMYTKAAFDEALEEVKNPAFILHTGDVVEEGLKEEQWNLYFKALGEAGASIPHFATPGNHDDNLTTANQNFYFGMHFNHPDNGGNAYLDPTVVSAINALGSDVKDAAWAQLLIKYMDETFYSYNYGDAHFIVYNSGSYSAQDDLIMKAQRAWLKADLEANKDAKWTIVLAHQGVYHRYGGGYDRNTLADILEGFDVDLVIQGHSHLVTRSYPMKNGEIVTKENPDLITKGDGTVYMLIGATALNHDRIGDYPNIEEQAVVISNVGEQPTYAVFNVTENSIKVTIKQVNGLVLDEFSIVEAEEEEEKPEDVVYTDDFHYFTYADLAALGMWETENSGKYSAKAPSFSSQRIELTDKQSVQFNWLKAIGGIENYDPTNTYVFEFDANVTSWGTNSAASTRTLYVAPGGYYNQVGLHHSDSTMQVGETTTHAYTYDGEETFRIRIEWCGKTITSTVTDSKGKTITGSRTKDNYVNVASDSLLQTMVFRCEDGTVFIDNFTFKSFSDVEIDGYGTLPSNYADAELYPIVLFQDGLFKQAFAANQFKEALTDARGLVLSHTGVQDPDKPAAKILLRGDAVSLSREENVGQAVGKIDINLNGFTLTQNHDGALFWLRTKTYSNESQSLTFKVRNGSISIKSYLFAIGTQGSTTGEFKSADLIFENVNIEVQRGVKLNDSLILTTNGSISNNTNTTVDYNITFTDCVFDLSKAAKNSLIFNLNNAAVAVKPAVSFAIEGGEIKLSRGSVDTTIYALNDVSSLTLSKGSNDKYVGLVLPTQVTTAAALTNNSLYLDSEISSNGTSDGNEAKFVKTEETALNVTYSLQNKTSEAVYIEGYGTIPADKADEKTYPIVIFQNGEFKAAFGKDEFDKALSYPRTNLGLKDEANPAPAKILLRGDATVTTEDQNLGQTAGVIDINLNGFTLTQTHTSYLFYTRTKTVNNFAQKFTLNVYDGNIVLGGQFFAIGTQNGGTTTGPLKDAELNFTNLNVSLSAPMGSNTWFVVSTSGTVSGTSDTLAQFDVRMNDCVIDLTKLKKANQIFQLNAANTNIDFEINGGELIAGQGDGSGTHPWRTSLYALGSSNASMTFGKGGDGKYLTLTAHTDINTYLSKNNPTIINNKTFYTNDGAVAKFINPVTIGDYVSYTLQPEVYIEGYGTIPAEKADANAYPIVFFQSGEFKGAYTKSQFTEAMSAARSAVGTVGAADAKLLLRGNVTATANDQNLGAAVGTIDVNLNGFTVTQTDTTQLFFARTKTYSADKQSFTLNVYGGEIIVRGNLLTLGTQSNSTYEQYKSANLNFTNVKITAAYGIERNDFLAHYSNGSQPMTMPVYYTIEFTNCVFDVSGLLKATNVLNFNNTSEATPVAATVNVNGGEIVLGSTTANSTIYTSNDKSNVTFGKGSDGSYLKLTVPSKVTSSTVNNKVTLDTGVECVFAKTSVDGEYATYQAYPEVMVGYKIKSSVSLYSNLIYNIYVPINDYLSSVSVNGENVILDESMITELADGKYYRIPVSLAVADSLDDIVLSVSLISGDSTVSAKWTLNVAKYAKIVLGGNESDEEKSLVRDMLSYARAAYVYFNTTGRVSDEELLRAKALVDELIGADYDANNTPEMNEEAINTVGGEISSASVDLGEKISLVFVVGSGYAPEDFEFTMGGAKLEKTVVGNKVYLTTYGYAIRNTVEYTVSGTDVSGSFNLMCYYENTSASVQALLARLIKYSESAEVYKNFVVGKEM